MAKSKREVLTRGHNWMRQKHQRPGGYDEEGRCVGPGGGLPLGYRSGKGPPQRPCHQQDGLSPTPENKSQTLVQGSSLMFCRKQVLCDHGSSPFRPAVRKRCSFSGVPCFPPRSKFLRGRTRTFHLLLPGPFRSAEHTAGPTRRPLPPWEPRKTVLGGLQASSEGTSPIQKSIKLRC